MAESFSDIADKLQIGAWHFKQSWSPQPCCNAWITTYITCLRTGWHDENKSSTNSGCSAHAPDPWCRRALSVFQASKAPKCLSNIPVQLAFLHVPVRLGTKRQKCTSDLLQKSQHGQPLQARKASYSTVSAPDFPHKAILSPQLHEAGALQRSVTLRYPDSKNKSTQGMRQGAGEDRMICK